MPEAHSSPISRLRQTLRIAAAAPRAGLVGGLLLIGCALLLLFRGFGLGTSGAATDASPTDYAASAATPRATPRSLDENSDAHDTVTNPADAAAKPQPVITILIDERSYRLQISAEPEPVYRETSLEQIRRLAAQTTGDSNQIRVHILRRETARQSAETALHEALAAVGIKPDAIRMPSEIVP
ncbi:MAG: hypothetical protein RLZZ436_1843 [Planctomycetota bacterium]